MHKLIIRAHPKHNTGYNFALCTAIQAAAQHAGHEVEMIDLYHEMPQGFLVYDRVTHAYQAEMHAKLTRADEYIFVFPIRGLDCPAIMKNFIDVNMGQ
jgi:putative NADPH-quinone reductase